MRGARLGSGFLIDAFDNQLQLLQVKPFLSSIDLRLTQFCGTSFGLKRLTMSLCDKRKRFSGRCPTLGTGTYSGKRGVLF